MLKFRGNFLVRPEVPGLGPEVPGVAGSSGGRGISSGTNPKFQIWVWGRKNMISRGKIETISWMEMGEKKGNARST